ncbi:MAG: hypothetical protein R3C56_41200 [Pirellulaceae bacterium]
MKVTESGRAKWTAVSPVMTGRKIVALLYRRYPNGDFLPVPADDGGDLGMDGVGKDGVVYQIVTRP